MRAPVEDQKRPAIVAKAPAKENGARGKITLAPVLGDGLRRRS
jgi:hypothetical protein